MKVLITGANGFLGGRLALFLKEIPNIELLLGVRRDPLKVLREFSSIAIDFSFKGNSISEIVSIIDGVDCIVHLAALNDKQSIENPWLANDVNVGGTIKLLAAAKIAKVRRFIYVSTAHIYGTPLCGEITEETLPRPVNAYAITHRSAEDYVLMAHHRQELEGVVLRLSNAFGYPISLQVNCHHLLVNDLCNQVIKGQKIQLQSSGMQYRNFISINEVVGIIRYFLLLPAELLLDGLFNVGTDQNITVKEMATLVAKRGSMLFGKEYQVITKIEQTLDDSFQLNYVVEKLKRTGYAFNNLIIKEIDEILFFYRSHV